MKYIEKTKVWGDVETDTESIVRDFISHDRSYHHADVGIEARLERMQDLFCRLVDKLDVNVLEIVKPGEVKGHYSVTYNQD